MIAHKLARKPYLLLVLVCLLTHTMKSLAQTTKDSPAWRNQYIASHPTTSRKIGAVSSAGAVYPQFRSSSGVVRWISDQMPLKVYISNGLTLDNIVDPVNNAPLCNINNTGKWPDVAAQVLENPERLQSLPVAEGFLANHYQAALEGISEWKRFENEGLFSFQFSNNPADADIYLFWTKQFRAGSGFALLYNDIRGCTAKWMAWYRDVQAGKNIQFKPVVIIMRTTDSVGSPKSFAEMKAGAAHEFGHALGIDGHSTNSNDLMSINYGHGVISNNDAATIRYLYHLTPDLIP